MLDQILPFRYLPRAEREALQAHLVERRFSAGEVLIEQGDADDKRVFLLLEGSVRAVDAARGRSLNVVTAGHYVGDRSALFDEPRAVQVVAVTDVRAWVLPGEAFVDLVESSTIFAQALSRILRDKQGIFTSFERFRVELVGSAVRGMVDLATLLPRYLELQPALHPHANDPDVIDVGALTYAVRRLPDNVTRTLSYFLTGSLPALYADPDRRFTFVPTAARRRAVYEMLPGKTMILVRDGVSDLVDLVTCLCLYAVEARKIRRRIRDAGGLEHVDRAALEPLRAVWGDEVEQRCRELALHHEDFRIEVHQELDNYNSAHAETWCMQIAQATEELLGHDPSDLPDDLVVHVISSNTHSVPNCVSPWLGTTAATILDWGRRVGHELVAESWLHEFDLVCALAPAYLAAHPDLAEERQRIERAAGIHTLAWTAFTGIAVQLIDTARVDWADTDPGIPDAGPPQRALIVNIDYAFGEQAEHIIANLVSLFGANIASVSVIGKAGGLQGTRGDILVADGFIDEVLDQYEPVPHTGRARVERLREDVPDREVHVGPMLTVAGTLLQNRTMLQFHKRLSRCIGLEMEGVYYLRHLVESMHRGAIAPDVALHFLYYTSDLPLDHDASLSARLRAAEGVPPLYAVTREVLRGILEPSG